jgi:hypothetical protein
VIEGVPIPKAVYVSNNPLIIDTVRIIVTPEIEVGTTLITVHVAQVIDIIKLMITVHVATKHRRISTLVVTNRIGIIFIVQTPIPFADVFPTIPSTRVKDLSRIGQPLLTNIAQRLIPVRDHARQETTTLHVTIEPDET